MDVADIISRAGGKEAVAAAIGKPINTVVYWKRRGRIPVQHWEKVIGLTAQHAHPITTDALAALWYSASQASI